MLKAVAVLVQGDEVSHGLFSAIIVAQDKLEFDAHGWLLRVEWMGE
jgi:hypothetical protein